MNKIAQILLLVLMLSISWDGLAQINIIESGGWLETAFVKWSPFSGAESYNVYCSGQGLSKYSIDRPLIRRYGSYMRADVPGLAAGSYTLEVVPVVNGIEDAAHSISTPVLIVKAHLREGFAFTNGMVPGAYQSNGTPKSGAVVIYVTESNANTVTCDVKNNKGVPTTYSGIMNILTNKGKGYDKTPLIIRVIGTVRTVADLNNGNFLYFGGYNNTTRQLENITLEGIGEDATVYGFGIGFKRAKGIEVRNVGIMLFGDDGVGMDTDNSYIWIHNCDFFYGKPGADADQVKGDGSIDMKYNSSRISLSYNHFWDSGKVMGCGGATGEDSSLLISFHHNWFDHADSRCPRLTNTTAHVYNNYYDGVAKYSVGTAYNTSAFVEANYFRGGVRPMTISGQGTDTYNSATGSYDLEGTFSGQNGGMTKAFGNTFDNTTKFVDQNIHATQFDAYTVSARNERIPATVASVKGGFVYNNFDTDATMYPSTPDSPDDAKAKVLAYAGRMNGGDFKWSFVNSVDDISAEVNAPLKAAIINYQSSLLSIQGIVGLTSPKSVDGGNKVQAWFNPSTNKLEVRSSEIVSYVRIYSLDGICRISGQTVLNQLEAGSLQPGMYVMLVTANGRNYKLIFMK
jgi:pectate lyase